MDNGHQPFWATLEWTGDAVALVTKSTEGALECAEVCLSWAQIWAQTDFEENLEVGNCLK